MFLFERNALVTISPKFDQTFPAESRFRWSMHVSLPFPYPSKKCIRETATIGSNDYTFEIHNHFDRLFFSPKTEPTIPRVILHDRRKAIPNDLKNHHVNREYLQSVVVFQDMTEHPTPNEAFRDASAKIQACFEYLAQFLAHKQREAPYLTAWLVYPIFLFDVGTVYHSVHRYCTNHDAWHVFATAPAISLARRLQHPLFFLDAEDAASDEAISNPLIDPANELLAEAQMPLSRELPRLAVLNSYGAVEALANVVFTKVKTEMLVSNNVPKEIAENLVEEERQRHKTEISFLLHRGLNACCSRSLHDEHQQKYEAIRELQTLRHKVAHTGHKPTSDEAREGHKLACECVQWLADVGGLPVKQLLPTQEAQVHGFSTTASDINAINAGEFEFLRYAMGFIEPPNLPLEEPPPQ